MKTKKNGKFAVLAAMLLVAALLLTNCLEPVGSLTGGLVGTETPPAGMGFIRLNINNPNLARSTILPDIPAVEKYKVTLTPTSGGEPQNNVEITSSGGNTYNPITAVVGTYTVTVTAYDSSDSAFAVGTKTGVTVSTSTDAEPGIEMKEVDLTGTGVFEWDFSSVISSLSLGGSDTAGLKFVALGPGNHALAPADINLIDNPASTAGTAEIVNSGYYNVTVTIKKSGNFDYAENRVVHIYQGMTSKWNQTDAITLVSNTHTITLNANGGTVTGGNSRSVPHGETFTIPAATLASNTLDGWHTKDGLTNSGDWGTTWIFQGDPGAMRVFYPRTLHARWTPVTNGNVVITLTPLSNIDNISLTRTGGAIQISILNIETESAKEEATPDTGDLKETIIIDDDDDYEDYEWYINGSLVTGEATGSLEINFAALAISNAPGDAQKKVLTTVGIHAVTVLAKDTTEGKFWSGKILVEITAP